MKSFFVPCMRSANQEQKLPMLWNLVCPSLGTDRIQSLPHVGERSKQWGNVRCCQERRYAKYSQIMKITSDRIGDI